MHYWLDCKFSEDYSFAILDYICVSYLIAFNFTPLCAVICPPLYRSRWTNPKNVSFFFLQANAYYFQNIVLWSSTVRVHLTECIMGLCMIIPLDKNILIKVVEYESVPITFLNNSIVQRRWSLVIQFMLISMDNDKSPR